jgi:signal transduction histidine kinase
MTEPTEGSITNRGSPDRADRRIDTRIGAVAAHADLGVVADALAAGRTDILQRWLDAARSQPFHRERPSQAVADHIPRLFDAVVALLRRDAARDVAATGPMDDPAITETATAHAQRRFEQGLGPVAVVTEFRLLRHEISRSMRGLLDDDAPPDDVVAGLAIVGDALDGAATVGLTALSDRIERLRESFLATTMHDVRQPVTLVSGSLVLAHRWLGADDVDMDRVRDSIGDALLASTELVAMIDTMSDASRVAMGALDSEPEPASLEAIVHEAIDAMGSTVRDRLRVVIDAGPRLIGEWDANLLRRVVTNLVGNALKYSPAGSEVTVEVGPGQPGFARLTIRDRGLGMSADELRVAFDRFSRADRARRQASGLGLGLYACRGIVTAHHGTIEIRSDGHDAGTSVEVELPLLPPDKGP